MSSETDVKQYKNMQKKVLEKSDMKSDMESDMKLDKRKTFVRLFIYLILSILPFIIIIPIINSCIGEKLFVSKRMDIIYAVGVFGMLIPSIAHILTRILTKEGFNNTYLLPNLKGNGKYYLSSILVILGNVLIESIIAWRVFIPQFSLSDVYHNTNGIAGILLYVAISLIFFLPAFGEEWGWRGYMMPKLIELMGKPMAIIAGGIIWGLWHAPLTISGHNFGIDYPGYPWLGILIMCIFCTAMNAFLTLLTERTKSIYPATFAHMINNNVNLLVFFSGISTANVLKVLQNNMDNMKCMIVMLPVLIVIGGVSYWLVVRKQEINN